MSHAALKDLLVVVSMLFSLSQVAYNHTSTVVHANPR
jgi:hypothetical protein